LSSKDAAKEGEWEPSDSGRTLLSRTSGTNDKATASVIFNVTATRPGLYSAYMKSEHGTKLTRLPNLEVLIRDSHGSNKISIDQTDPRLDLQWAHLGTIYVSGSTTDAAPTITFTNAGGDHSDQRISIGTLKLVSQETYPAFDQEFTPEQTVSVGKLFQMLDQNNDGLLRIEDLDPITPTIIALLGDRENEARALAIDYLDSSNGTINRDQFNKIVANEINQAYASLSENVERGIALDGLDERADRIAKYNLFTTIIDSNVEREVLLNAMKDAADTDGYVSYNEFTTAAIQAIEALGDITNSSP
jgi:Ca2+-binding EF-hand superfamily protein